MIGFCPVPRSPATAAAATATIVLEATPSGFLGVTNPFLNSLQSNPFFEDLKADIALNSPSPAPSLPSASRASLAPLASPGKALPEWDDTFNIFAAGRLQPEARSGILAPAGMGLEEDGLQDPGPRTVAVKAAEPQGEPGRGRGGSSIWLEPKAPVHSELDQPSTSLSDSGPLGSSGTGPSSRAAQLHLQASASTPDRELPASEGGAGQSPADSGTSLFSSPEVLSVWERFPGSDDTPGSQDKEVSQDGSQLFQELNTVEERKLREQRQVDL